jgi:hypothetical protein
MEDKRTRQKKKVGLALQVLEVHNQKYGSQFAKLQN